MRYYTREEADKATYERIEDLRTTAAYYPAIKKVIQDFSGKVYNKRFVDAIEKATGARTYAHKYSLCDSIQIHGTGMNDWHYILSIKKEDLKDGKRIDAAKLIDQLTETRTEILKEATILEEQAGQIDRIKEQLTQLRATYDALVKPLSSTICSNYNIEKYARF